MNSTISYAPKSKDKVSHPKLLESISSIINIICGRDHCLAITSFHEVLAWGNNDKGQLGLPFNQEFDTPRSVEDLFLVYTPTSVESLSNKKLDNIATATDHSFAWSSETGEAYAWGSGAYGKLGFGYSQDYSEPSLLDCFKEASTVGMRVSQIVCGDEHSLAILENIEERENSHRLFVWGCAKSWQLGLEGDVSEDVLEPHALEPDPWDGKIRYIGACNNYSCAVTMDGEVYTWGSGEFGRLGYETETRQQRVPRMVKGVANIQRVALGIHHAVAVTNAGIIYSWGRGINGQLGHGEIANEDRPKQVKALSEKRITDICCGENHTMAVTENGEAFSWGAGQFGQLGHGDLLRQTVPMKVQIYGDDSVKIIKVSAGRRHSVALDDKGRVFVWGCNDLCQLGLKTIGGGNTNKKYSQIFPEERLRHGSLSIDTLSLDNFTFSPPQWQLSEREKIIPTKKNGMNSKEQKMIEDLQEENKFLKNRIKELELKSNLNSLKEQQQKLYDVTMQYIAKLEVELSGKKGNTINDIIVKNAKIDTLCKDFGENIRDMSADNLRTVAFCIDIFEKICDLKKKSNYAVSQ